MSAFAKSKHHPLPRRTRGMALVVVLLFLVVITGATIWSVRLSTMAEGSARNQLDAEIARQAAESALRDAERDIINTSTTLLTNASCNRGLGQFNPNDFKTDCTNGLCLKTDANYSTSNWADASSTNTSVAEPWWPKSKGGLWNDDFSNKPGRSPVTTDHCSFTGGVPLGTYTGTPAIRGVAVQPEYMIEVFRRKNVRINVAEPMVVQTGQSANQWSTMYRITARGFGYSQRTQVLLQSIFFP